MASILGLDVGTRKIGVARAELRVGLAAPLTTVERQGVNKDVARLAELCRREGATGVVVGLPYDLQGNEGRSARLARQVGDALGAATGLAIHWQDERFTTVEASDRLHQAGIDARRQRSIIDQSAAAVILQDWLDARDAGGR